MRKGIQERVWLEGDGDGERGECLEMSFAARDADSRLHHSFANASEAEGRPGSVPAFANARRGFTRRCCRLTCRCRGFIRRCRGADGDLPPDVAPIEGASEGVVELRLGPCVVHRRDGRGRRLSRRAASASRADRGERESASEGEYRSHWRLSNQRARDSRSRCGTGK